MYIYVDQKSCGGDKITQKVTHRCARLTGLTGLTGLTDEDHVDDGGHHYAVLLGCNIHMNIFI